MKFWKDRFSEEDMRIEPCTAGCEGQILPLFHVVPELSSHIMIVSVFAADKNSFRDNSWDDFLVS